jgi:translocation and assembly module TamA
MAFLPPLAFARPARYRDAVGQTRRHTITLAAMLALLHAAHAADPMPYTVKIAPTGQSALDAALSGSAQLVALRTRAPAGPFAVVARARADIPRLRTALESFGYYAGTIEVTVAGHGVDDPNLPAILAAGPAKPPVPIAVRVDRGPLFTLGHVGLDGTVPAAGRRAFSLRPGEPALAARVLGAGGAVLAALREDGYALAAVDAPVAVLVPAAHALDVSFHVTPGPRVDLGPIALHGLVRVNPAYVRRRLLVHPGQLYQPSKIEAARQDLASVGVFSGVTVRAAPALDSAGTLPVTFDFAERPRHAVAFTVAYSTDLGGSVGATWSHRNVFGNAEQLNLGASMTGLGGSAVTGLGYDVTAQLIKPDFLRRDQQIEFDLGAIRQDLQAYQQTAFTAGTTLTRKLSRQWSVSVGLTAEQEQVIQEGVTRDYTLVAVPVSGKFDSTALSNPLDDATHGIRATLGVAPTRSITNSATFVILQGSASAYFDLAAVGLSRPGASVLAVRGLVGSAQGADQFALPPDQRFYAGGSATVRGFKYQSVGPLFADHDPEGGGAVDAASVEFRQRVWGNIGAAVFVDAAQVDASSAPFEGTLREGVGVGARYYTPIGPIRVDVAVPLNAPPGGDAFELYLGLGQAF